MNHNELTPGKTEQFTAILSNQNPFTCFSYGKHRIRFRTSNHLERYTKVLAWDKGYLEVMAKYDNSAQEEEEYIDLVPILENLYFNPDEFLKQIKDVKIQYV